MRITGDDGGRRSTAAASVALAVCGLLLLAVGFAGQQQVPDPPALAVQDRTAGGRESAPEPSVAAPVLARSAPVSLTIPSIGVHSPELVELGLAPDRSMEVPRDFDLAGWYRHGPTPGEPGPAVIAGHVDSAEAGPAVFFRLAELPQGARVLVERADERTAVYAVDRVVRYPKDEFPTLEVYGYTARPELRLITCGGRFDRTTGHYRDNVVAFARLVDVR